MTWIWGQIHVIVGQQAKRLASSREEGGDTVTLMGIFMQIHSVTLPSPVRWELALSPASAGGAESGEGINEQRVLQGLITGHGLLSRILGEE